MCPLIANRLMFSRSNASFPAKNSENFNITKFIKMSEDVVNALIILMLLALTL